MVPFAGYEMPVQYAMGVLKKHHHTRAAAGLRSSRSNAVVAGLVMVSNRWRQGWRALPA